jgi:iron complex outermembrane receptor protein
MAVALAVAGAQAAAQAPAESGGGLEEVVVTAQFREQRLQDTPIAISAITAEALEAKGATDIAMAANTAPNVALTRGAAGFGQMASVFIRGVGQADPHFAVEPGVGMYIDDVYYGVLTGAVFQLLDVDRVEVLRGPQGTLAGKNSIGGSIKLFSKRPSDQQDGFVEASYGSFNRVQARAAGNFTIVDDRLFGRVAVAGKHVDGYVTRLDHGCVTGTAAANRSLGPDCKLGTQGGEDFWSVRGALLWKVSDNIENLLSLDLIADNSENPPAKQLVQSPLWTGGANYLTGAGSYTNYENNLSTPADLLPGVFPAGTFRNAPFAMPSETPLRGSGVSNQLTVDFSDTLSLKSITALRRSDVTFVAPVDATPATVLDQVWRLKHKQFTQEFRLTGSSEMLDWTAGLFYYKADGQSGGRVVIPGGLAVGGGGLGFDIFFQDPVETESKSAFLHTNWSLSDALSATAAVRYTEDSKQFTFNRWDIAGDPYFVLPGLVDFPVKYSGDRFDYRLGVDYQWNQDLMTYAQVSTGYKGGGVNPRPFFSTQAVTYKPETLTAYEVGLKSQLLDRRVQLNAAAFINKYKDFQSTLLRCPSLSPAPDSPCTQSTNVGDADIRGLEVELVVRPDNGLQLDLSAGWLDFEYQRINPDTGISLDMTNIYTPDFTMSAGLGYAIDLGDHGTLTPRVDYAYRSEIQSEAVNQAATRIDSRGVLDAKLTWSNRERSWDATLALTNLSDKFYYESMFGRPDPPYFSSTGRPGRPREWMLTIRRNFD